MERDILCHSVARTIFFATLIVFQVQNVVFHEPVSPFDLQHRGIAFHALVGAEQDSFRQTRLGRMDRGSSSRMAAFNDPRCSRCERLDLLPKVRADSFHFGRPNYQNLITAGHLIDALERAELRPLSAGMRPQSCRS